MKAFLRFLSMAALVAVAACATASHDVAPDPVPPPAAGPHAVTYLVLGETGPAEGQHTAYFSAEGATRVSLAFLPQGRGAYSVAAVCDGRSRTRDPDGEVSTPAWTAAGQSLALRIAPGARMQTWLDLDPATTRCDLTVTPGGRPAWTLDLRREDTALPAVARLDARDGTCTGAGGDVLERAFMANFGLAASCPVAVGPTRLLPDGIDALNAKIEALTGRAASRAALEAGNPDMALDYSQAPQLDLIYVTYLNLNADFAGYLTARMLAWHAARGTIVRILVADVMLTSTDRRLFEGLAARYPTVQIQPFRLPATAAQGLDGQLGRLHRVTHVKMFATLAREPGRSRAMVGGRNIHEGYYYSEPRDLSGYPFLHQYNPDVTRLTGGFSAYEDFEIELSDERAVRSFAGHMASLWHRDHDTQTLRPPLAETRAIRGREGMVRHFISIPFVDGEAQADYYAGLIDAAQHRIRIAIPYLNLPAELDAALRRAQGRGVQVDVVTTVRVREATDFMVTGLNRTFANAFGGWVRFFDYDPVPRLLHAKLIVIDDRLVVIGSTNLNRRSFAHDLENGLVFLDRGVAAGVDRVIQSYIDQAERVPPTQPIPRLVRWLSTVGVISRAF